MTAKITTVVPCYNEQEALPYFVEEIKKVSDEMASEYGVEFEFLFINDGSADRTLQLLRKEAQADPRVRYVSFSRNFGKEAAIYAGLKGSTGDYVVLMDADLQHPPAMLKEMYEAVSGEGYQIAAARRVTRKGEPPIRSFFARMFYRLINKISKAEFVDGASDFRMLSRSAVDAILQMTEYNRFSKGIFGWIGFETKWIEYENVERVAGKTLKSILISCGARLAPFDIKELRDLMETDEMELDTLGDSKAALFVIISDTDTTFNFVAALMYSQLFNLLCDKADDFYGGRLPVHVRLILDEFANIGQIPNFDKLIATIRSREISASIILQSQSQLKTIYKDAADTIVGNCDSTLFLGGKEKSTLKEISELLGKETIDSYNQSENRGSQISHGLSYQKLGKELMSQDELAVMDGGKCIFMLRGVRPFLSDKYDLTKHPNYKYTADADPKNVFDMERYMKKQRAVVKPTDSFDVYEIDGNE